MLIASILLVCILALKVSGLTTLSWWVIAAPLWCPALTLFVAVATYRIHNHRCIWRHLCR